MPEAFKRLLFLLPEVFMDTILCEIAKNRMERDFNEALKRLGLYVTEIHFDDSEGLSVVLEISAYDQNLFCA